MVPGTLIDGRFEIERKVETGGMGVIFRALDRLDGATVAVKLLCGEASPAADRFEREAAVLAELRHPGIVRYIVHGITPEGRRYIAMEWLSGEDLERRCARRRLTLPESLVILRKTAAALAVVHARGVVHRDLKPSNIFLVEGDIRRVKLLDFGLARRTEGAARLTQPGMLVGTPAYMAPEQAKGSPALDARTDVFSLGCVLFECLIGRPAFEGTHVMAILAKVVLQPVPPLQELRKDMPEPVERLLSRMLAKNPAERPQDAAAVVAALDALGDLGGAPLAQAPDLTPTLDAIAPPSPRTAALTVSEQRLVSVVLAGAPPAQGAGAAQDLARSALEHFGGRLDVLADGSMLVMIGGTGSAVDRVERAARCALTLRSRFAAVPIHVVTGRGVVSTRMVEGEVIDRGVRALRAIKPGAVKLDSVTAGMLGPRFITEPDGDAFALRGEHILLHETAPLLLGKPTPCVGRGHELSLLKAWFDICASESMAGAVLVIGPAGAGKSRLRREFVEGLRKHPHPVEILSGRGDSLGESSPFGLIADAIRRAAGICDGEPIESRRQKLTQRLGQSLEGAALARASAFLGEFVRIPFPDSDDQALRAARENAMLMGDAMRAAWEEWLAAECAAQPVVLVLEDLHWGDAATVRLIDSTLRNLRYLPFMVLVLARPEVHTRFPGLVEQRTMQIVKLNALSRKASEQLVREALGQGVDAGTVGRIVERADGNPFYLEELIRAVAAGRGDAFPDSVLGTVEARLDAEGSSAKRVLRAASVFGDRFSKQGVAALLGGGEHVREAAEWLDTLASRELIFRTDGPGHAEDTGYTFLHTLVREAAYAMLTDADRTLGHRLAGAWLETIGSPDAMAMAEHFRRGGEPGRSVRWYRRAAEQALEANDLPAVLERVEGGVACGASDEDLGALRLVEAEADVWRGELALAERRGLEAVSLLPPGTAMWFRAVSQVVIAAGKLGNLGTIERFIAQAPAAAEGAFAARITCLCLCACHLIFGGRYGVVDTLIEAIDRASREEPALEIQALAALSEMRAIRASAAGDPSACLDHLNAAKAAFEQAGDQRDACVARANIGFVLAELGDFKGAEDSLRAALAGAARMGLHDLSAAAVHNLGHSLSLQGHLEDARSLEQQAVAAFHQQGDPRLEGLARTYLARIDLLAGDLAAAEREARAAEALLAAPPLRSVAGAVLARALLGQGRADEALHAAREAFSLLESLGTIEESESLVRLVYAEALAANGREREFVDAITSARDHLLGRAAKISDPAWRERFLTGLPDSARTLDLCAQVIRAPRIAEAAA